MVKRNLIYTIAIDPPGESVMAGLAKILVASLLRTYFTGEIVIFHNSPRPIFEVERKDLIEIFISTPSLSGKEIAEHAWTWKYRAAGQIDGSAYEKVLYLDADCIAQRNIDHLISDDADILVQREKGQLISSPQFNCFLSNEECEGARNEGRDGVVQHFLTLTTQQSLLLFPPTPPLRLRPSVDCLPSLANPADLGFLDREIPPIPPAMTRGLPSLLTALLSSADASAGLTSPLADDAGRTTTWQYDKPGRASALILPNGQIQEKCRGTEAFWTEAKPEPEGRAAGAGAASQNTHDGSTTST